MEFQELEIKGVWLIKPQRFGDSRGYFSETWKQQEFEEHVGKVNFIQDNESQSIYGVLRGLHLQRGEWSQAKLVRVSMGKVLDIAVDLRTGSPTRGKHVAVILSQEGGEQLFIPRGFAHGFVVLSDLAQFQYKVDNVYAPHSEMTIAFNDPDLGIDWILSPDEMLLSEKDKMGMWLKDVKSLEF
jgi:dTDP-4-dehydrorhamnose 3,5-epimerase